MIGESVRQYLVLERLGSGGMGVVYKARDTRLQRGVALKVLADQHHHSKEATERFEREAQSTSALNHPGICTIYETGDHGGRQFIAMELLEGSNLADRIAQGPLPLDEVLAISLQVLDALDAIHALGIVHRDLKPANVFLTGGGRVKVLDFGIAKFVSETAQTLENLTVTGVAHGTVAYMSPEQARAETVDTRSDLFSFGAVLYEMATGQRAFGGRAQALVFDSLLNREAKPPSSVNPELPPAFDAIVERSLEKDRELRYRTAAEMRADVLRLKQDRESGAVTAPAAPARAARSGRRRLLWAGAALAAVATLVSLTRPSVRSYDSVAVLPFANASGDPEAEYLSDGITEAVINGLSSLGRLRVVPRSSVFRYKGRESEAQRVGRELNVAAVVTGRVVQRGGSLTIAAELIDVEQDAQIWGERYSRRLAEILSLQEDLARAVAERLTLRLSADERDRLNRRYTENTEAYRLYLQGRHQWEKRSVEGIVRSISLFQEAIARDAGYSLAYAGLADAYVAQRDLAPKETRPKAREAALQALGLDESLAEAHTSLAMTRFVFDWDWPGAEASFRRAIALTPVPATAHHWYGLFLMAMGRFDEARAQITLSIEKDPFSLMPRVNRARIELYAGLDGQAAALVQEVLDRQRDFAWAHGYLSLIRAHQGRLDEAVASAQQARALDDSVDAPAWTGYAYARAGRREDALREIRTLEAAGRKAYLPPFRVALVHAALGDKDRAFAWLDKACEDRSPWLPHIGLDPMLEPLRSDPRFKRLLRKVGLPGG